MGKNRRQDKTETLRERLQEEQTRLLFEIDKAASTIEGMSAGKIYSAYGAKAVQRLDALTQAEEKLLRNHDSDEKKRVDRVIYYKEMGVAHQQVGDKHYYMIILMR